jgi:hypothetical protein
VTKALRALAGALASGLAGAALASAPDARAVQDAYDAARVDNAERHAYDLVIQGAKCSAIEGGGYACQIDFVRRAEPDKRLYFDVVTIDERQGHWTLLGGLCVKTPR